MSYSTAGGESTGVSVSDCKSLLSWVNTNLKERQIKDFKNGLAFLNLLEVLAIKKGSKNVMPKYNKAPKDAFRYGENNTHVMDFVKKEGVHTSNIGPGDLTEGNEKLTLALIFALMEHYHFKLGYREARNALLEWIKRKIPDYNITGFSGKQWNDGKALNALIDALSPGTCPNHASLGPDQKANWVKGLEAALKKFEIPKIIDPMNSELTDPTDPDVNERDLVMYLSYYPKAFEKEEKEAEERRKKEAEEAAKRKALEEEAARKKAEEDRLKREAEEAARKKKEEEDAAKKKAADEEAARKKAEEDARKKAADEEAARKKAEEDARKKAEEDARKKAEEDARKKAEEDARKKAEEDAAQRQRDQDAADFLAKKKADDEAKRKAEEEARRKKDEEDAAERARLKAIHDKKEMKREWAVSTTTSTGADGKTVKKSTKSTEILEWEGDDQSKAVRVDNPDMDVTKFAAAESIGPGFSPTKESSTDFKVNVGDSAKPKAQSASPAAASAAAASPLQKTTSEVAKKQDGSYFSGWVWKKPRGERKITMFSTSKWKHRYFVLTPDGQVSYFENAAGPKEIEAITSGNRSATLSKDKAPLNVKAAGSVKLVKCKPSDSHKKDGYHMMLVCDSSEVNLCFDLEAERENFINAISTVNPKAIVE